MLCPYCELNFNREPSEPHQTCERGFKRWENLDAIPEARSNRHVTNHQSQNIMAVPTLLPTNTQNETFGGVTYHIQGELVPALQVELEHFHLLCSVSGM